MALRWAGFGWWIRFGRRVSGRVGGPVATQRKTGIRSRKLRLCRSSCQVVRVASARSSLFVRRRPLAACRSSGTLGDARNLSRQFTGQGRGYCSGETRRNEHKNDCSNDTHCRRSGRRAGEQCGGAQIRYMGQYSHRSQKHPRRKKCTLHRVA